MKNCLYFISPYKKEKGTEFCVGRKRACDEIFEMAETIQSLLFKQKKKSNTEGESNMNMLLCVGCL
jgi:hypothetical protein